MRTIKTIWGLWRGRVQSANPAIAAAQEAGQLAGAESRVVELRALLHGEKERAEALSAARDAMKTELLLLADVLDEMANWEGNRRMARVYRALKLELRQAAGPAPFRVTLRGTLNALGAKEVKLGKDRLALLARADAEEQSEEAGFRASWENETKRATALAVEKQRMGAELKILGNVLSELALWVSDEKWAGLVRAIYVDLARLADPTVSKACQVFHISTAVWGWCERCGVKLDEERLAALARGDATEKAP